MIALLLAGWMSLFDGSSTAGWTEITGAPFPATWTVENGCLKSLRNPHAMQDIRTVDTFRSFELEFEWKVAPGGNSGVKYLIERVDKWNSRFGPGYHARARGFEYQLGQDEGEEPSQTSGALYSYIAPLGAKLRPAGEFNTSRIIVRGRHVEHWLNGHRVVAYELASEPRESPIALQNHNSEAWFRSIRIRRLD